MSLKYIYSSLARAEPTHRCASNAPISPAHVRICHKTKASKRNFLLHPLPSSVCTWADLQSPERVRLREHSSARMQKHPGAVASWLYVDRAAAAPAGRTGARTTLQAPHRHRAPGAASMRPCDARLWAVPGPRHTRVGDASPHAQSRLLLRMCDFAHVGCAHGISTACAGMSLRCQCEWRPRRSASRASTALRMGHWLTA